MLFKAGLLLLLLWLIGLLGPFAFGKPVHAFLLVGLMLLLLGALRAREAAVLQERAQQGDKR